MSRFAELKTGCFLGLALLASVLAAGLVAAPAGASGPCKTVTKTVNGKRQHVRVCRKVTPPTPKPVFSVPRGVGVDSRGDVYVADGGANQILELSPSGKLLARLRLSRSS